MPLRRTFTPRVIVALVAVLIAALVAAEALGLFAGAGPARPGRVVQPTFFGQHLSNFRNNSKPVADPPWPVRAIRLLNSATAWCAMQPAPDRPVDFTNFDAWIRYAEANGADLLYTFGRPPGWAQGLTGGCKTSNTHRLPQMWAWRNFVTHLVRHARGKVRYWELWNEYDAHWSWPGTAAQMAQYAHEAAKIIHGANQGLKVLTPSASSYHSVPGKTIQDFLRADPPSTGDIDIVAFHSHVTDSHSGGAWPEAYLGAQIDKVRTYMRSTGYGRYPLWSTEGGWRLNETLRDYGGAAAYRAFVARYYLMMLSKGVERAYWYAYAEPVWGTLLQTHGPLDPGQLTPGGVAMNELVRRGGWLNDVTLDAPCAADATGLWRCDITRSDGRKGRILWVMSGTRTVSTPAGYTTLRTLSGGRSAAPPQLVVGIEPMLVEQ